MAAGRWMGSLSFFTHVSGAFSSWQPTVAKGSAENAAEPAAVRSRARSSGAIFRAVRIMGAPPLEGSREETSTRARPMSERALAHANEPKTQGAPELTPRGAVVSTRGSQRMRFCLAAPATRCRAPALPGGSKDRWEKEKSAALALSYDHGLAEQPAFPKAAQIPALEHGKVSLLDDVLG